MDVVARASALFDRVYVCVMTNAGKNPMFTAQQRYEMLCAANAQFNLTRVSEDIREACDRNYLDSLTLLKHLDGVSSLIDVGSGAGFPGIPLAIIRPDVSVVLLDSQGKRVEFLQSVIDALKLNARAVHLRSEDAAKQARYRDAFDAACARAVADMTVLSELLLPFVKPGGRMLALKGPGAEEETRTAAYAISELGGGEPRVFEAEIPERDWEHKIVSVPKLFPTPDRSRKQKWARRWWRWKLNRPFIRRLFLTQSKLRKRK